MNRLTYGLIGLVVLLLLALGYSAAKTTELTEKLSDKTTELEKTKTELSRVAESKSSTIVVEKPGGEKITYRTREKRVVEEKIVYKDRIVERQVTVKIAVPTQTELSRYSVGIAKNTDSSNDGNLSAGVRLGNLPLFLEGSVSTKTVFAAGLRFEF